MNSHRNIPVRLLVWLKPGSKQEGVVGFENGCLSVAVRAPAQEGKANEALISLLAGLLEIPKSQVSLVSGAGSRQKVIEVSGVERAMVEAFCLKFADLPTN